ncbi:hypothetical protein [Qipengyuania psychrotolerans]|uniref:DUF883 family protein n=1 Tax=Qipengyuania psychrotolerans TaxID=2867238 RepID=A0ABX8ZKW8_9SPHN|nr:hypothetical protein [Qipengyuania psychrotolerans]QZD88349.1 hypothetical protein K3166_06720 [Qipengyuania psychrotolerans]
MTDTTATNVTPISADSQLSDEQKREQLRARIEAGERRNEERSFADQAKEAADSAVDFAKKHPIATVAGAVAIGLAIGAMTSRGRQLGRRGGSLAAYAADAALAYGLSMVEGAGDKFEDYSDAAGTQARRLKRDAGYRADALGDVLRSSGRKASRKSSRTVRDLKARVGR